MNGLSTNLRTHILELTRDREIVITREQYKAIKVSQSMDKWNDLLMIHDPDTGKVLHDGLIKDILGFREIEKNDMAGSKFFCDFGNKHSIHISCDCDERYGVAPGRFRSVMLIKFPEVPYAQRLTGGQRKAIISLA